MDRQAFVERLRAWAGRADNEVAFAEGTTKITWQGQSAVLHSIFGAVGGGAGGGQDPQALRNQIIGERAKAIAAWEAAIGDANATAFHAGEVQAYELVLDLLQDVGAVAGAHVTSL